MNDKIDFINSYHIEGLENQGQDRRKTRLYWIAIGLVYTFCLIAMIGDGLMLNSKASSLIGRKSTAQTPAPKATASAPSIQYGTGSGMTANNSGSGSGKSTSGSAVGTNKSTSGSSNKGTTGTTSPPTSPTTPKTDTLSASIGTPQFTLTGKDAYGDEFKVVIPFTIYHTGTSWANIDTKDVITTNQANYGPFESDDIRYYADATNNDTADNTAACASGKVLTDNFSLYNDDTKQLLVASIPVSYTCP